jgi:hypothetical protein
MKGLLISANQQEKLIQNETERRRTLRLLQVRFSLIKNILSCIEIFRHVKLKNNEQLNFVKQSLMKRKNKHFY